MAAQPLDNEFLQYWAQLSVVEKESLLSVAKNYVQIRLDTDDTDALRKKIIRKERENYLQGAGISYSWEEVKEMAVNKRARHGL